MLNHGGITYHPTKFLNNMKRTQTIFIRTSIERKCDSTGLSIEETIRRAIASNQPLEGNAPMIFTPASEGVRPEHDIRTDKQNLALDAMDKYQASDTMKGYIGRVESDENGTDGKGNVVEDGQLRKEE